MINHENNSLKLEMSRGKGEDGRRGKKSHISSTAGRQSRAMATSRIQTRSLSVPRSSRPLHALSHHCLGWVIQILRATQNFSHWLSWEGGSGTVYRDVLSDGQIVAVKRAKKLVSCIYSFGCRWTSCCTTYAVPGSTF